MAVTAGMIAKAAATALSNEKLRKGIGWGLVAVLSPVILLIAALCSIGTGGADHNNQAVAAAFYGVSYSTEVPAAFRYHIEEMRSAFSLLDSAVASVNGRTEGGNSLDPIRVKAVFYALCFGENAPGRRAANRFVECFYTWETRTRTVEVENEDGTVTSTEEEYTVAVPVSLYQVYANLEAELGRTITEDDKSNINHIYTMIAGAAGGGSYSGEFLRGDGSSMALVTLHRLWEEGYTIAAHQLGKAYQDGLGTSIDRKAAAEWFQKSAEAGNTCSAYALGKLLLEQEQFPQVLHWLRQAAEQNDPYAQYRLGKLLLTGAEGVPKDIDAAIQLLKGSATQGNSFAQYTLGKLYLLGQEVQADREEALRYFAQAAAQGNTYAQYFIDHQDDFSGAAAGTAILRMLHQMSRIFRENAAQPAIYAGMQIDKKHRRRLQEKRMAMGHKADDHEDRGLTQQTQ